MVSPILIRASEQVTGTPIGSGTTIGNGVSGGNAGAVLFIDLNGDLAQAPTTFAWGVTNTRLGIGTNNPATVLQVKASQVTPNQSFLVGAPGSLSTGVTLSASNDGNTSYMGLEIRGSTIEFSQGNVGVKTATPQNAFDVSGALAVGTFAGVNTAPSNGAILSGVVGLNTSSPVGGAALDVTGNATINGITLRSQNAIQFNDSGSHYVGFKAPITVTSSVVWNLPTADGTVGQFFRTDGAGNLTFVSAGGSSAIGSGVSGGQTGSVLFIDSSGNLNQDNPNFYYSNTLHKLAVGLTTTTLATARVTSLVGSTGNMEGLFVSQADTTGNSNAVRILTTGGGNSLSVYHQANTAITDFAGAMTLDNTTNTGIGVNLYTNQAFPASLGSLLRVHAANSGYNAPAVYVRHDGTASGAPTVRLDANSPLIYINETAQTAPAGLYALDGKNDLFRVNGRRADNSTFDPFVVFQRLDQGGSNQGGSVGIRTGSNAGNSTLQVNGSFALGVNSVSMPYSPSNTDEYISVDASASPNGLTISLPQSVGVTGRIIHILKTDSTGNFVGIAPAGGDTIFRRPAKQLFAKNQVVSIIADGSTNWNPFGVIAYTPHYVGNTLDAGFTAHVGTANNAILIAFENRYPVTVNGVRLKVITSSGNIDVGVYDGTGDRLGSAGSTPCPSVGKNTVSLVTPASVYTPGVHYLALAADNITATFSLSGADAILGVYSFASSFPLPASFSLANPAVINLPFALTGVVAGGLAN